MISQDDHVSAREAERLLCIGMIISVIGVHFLRRPRTNEHYHFFVSLLGSPGGLLGVSRGLLGGCNPDSWGAPGVSWGLLGGCVLS
jgi:hypothetical protein